MGSDTGDTKCGVRELQMAFNYKEKFMHDKSVFDRITSRHSYN